MTMLLAQHNVPLALADHLSPMIRDIFDGDVAKQYACAKTKTACILNGAVAPLLKQELISVMQCMPFSLCVDGSSDTDVCKMNRLTVKIFDIDSSKVAMRFFDMCTTSGTDGATAEAIFTKINDVIGAQAFPGQTVLQWVWIIPV